jgi:uncharacterized protein (TIGR02266 family)
MADTRKDKRAPVSLKVRFKSATLDEFMEQYAKDISRGGVFIKSKQPMPIGTLLKFEIQLKDESPLIHGVGRVVWKKEAGDAADDSPSGMGIKFIRMDPECRALVDKIVNQRGDAPGQYEAGGGDAVASEEKQTAISQPKKASVPFFPAAGPTEAELPRPEDRTQVRHASEFLASALAEAGSDESAREAERKAEESRKRTAEIERERAAAKAREADAERARMERDAATTVADEDVDELDPEKTRMYEKKEELKEKPKGPPPLSDRPPAAAAKSSNGGSGAGKVVPATRPERTSERPAERSAASASAQRSVAAPIPAPPKDEPTSYTMPAIVAAVAVIAVGALVFSTMNQGDATVADPTTATPPDEAIAPEGEGTGGTSPEGEGATPEGTEGTVAEGTGAEGTGAEGTEGAVAQEGAEGAEGAEGTGAEGTGAGGADMVFPEPPPEGAGTGGTTAAGGTAATGGTGATGAGATEATGTAAGATGTPRQPAMAHVRIESTPAGATISVDGTERGTAPVEVDLAAGQPASIVARLAGYRETTTRVTPTAAQRVARVTLASLPYVIEVTTTPPGVRVRAGGRSATTAEGTPSRLTVPRPTAAVQLVGSRSGYQDSSATVAPASFVERGGEMVAEVSLTLAERPPPATTGGTRPPREGGGAATEGGSGSTETAGGGTEPTPPPEGGGGAAAEGGSEGTAAATGGGGRRGGRRGGGGGAAATGGGSTEGGGGSTGGSEGPAEAPPDNPF